MTDQENQLMGEIDEGIITSFPMLSIKARLMGVGFSDEFVRDLVRKTGQSFDWNMLLDGIRNGAFLANFKSDIVFDEILVQRWLKRYQYTTAVVEVIRRVRPGLLLSKFLHFVELREKEPRFGSAYRHELEWLDWIAYSLSLELAQKDEKYKNTYHKKIVDAFMSLRATESAMN